MKKMLKTMAVVVGIAVMFGTVACSSGTLYEIDEDGKTTSLGTFTKLSVIL